MVGWHHRLNENEFEQSLGDSEGQGSLACCSPWDRKQLDTTEQRNNNKTLATVSWRSLKCHNKDLGYLSLSLSLSLSLLNWRNASGNQGWFVNKVDQNWEACAERGEAGGWDPAVLRGREVHLRCLGGTGLGLTPEGGLHRPQRPRRREHLGVQGSRSVCFHLAPDSVED